MPVSVFRPVGNDRIVVHMPFAPDNRVWIREVCGEHTRPIFDRTRRAWLVARPHYRALLAGLIDRFGEITVIEDYALQEKCTVSCTNANPETVDECQCACGGDQHGARIGPSARSHWRQVSEELLVGTTYKRRTYVVRS